MRETCVTEDRKNDANREYDEQIEFVSYTVQKADGSRSYILQFSQDGKNEEFHCYSLFDSKSHSGEERQFERRYNILDSNDVVNKLAVEGTRYAMHIIPKGDAYLIQRIHQSFNALDAIRATRLSDALDIFCGPFRNFTGININPVEAALMLFERGTTKKAETGCFIL